MAVVNYFDSIKLSIETSYVSSSFINEEMAQRVYIVKHNFDTIEISCGNAWHLVILCIIHSNPKDISFNLEITVSALRRLCRFMALA